MILRQLFLLFFVGISFCPLFSQLQSDDLVVCWDTSKSMRERDLEKDFSVLEKAFQKTPNLEVRLILFGVTTQEKKFSIRDGNWLDLKNELSTVIYDGATIFSQLNPIVGDKSVLLFSDGNQLFEKDFLSLGKGSIIINSSLMRNAEFLNRIALINRSRLMDFASIKEYGNSKKEGFTGNRVSGTLYVDNVRAANIPILVKGRDDVSYTNSNGEFSLSASLNDSIFINESDGPVFAIRDIQGKELFISSEITKLDEVVLLENRRQAREPNTPPTDDKEGVGYAVQSIGDDDITAVNTNLNSAVTSRFSGVTTGIGRLSGADQDLSKFIVRGQSSLLLNNYGLIVVDGVPIKQSNSANDLFQTGNPVASTSFIDPELIEEVTVLKGMAATNRFGSLGANGVLLITTKNAVFSKTDKKVADRARLKNNVYDKKEILYKPEDSPFYKALASAKNIEEAYLNYASLRDFNENNATFYLDAFDFFSSRDKALAARVISNLVSLYPDDINSLKIAELCFTQLGNDTLAEMANNQILNIDTDNLQANYRKVTLIHSIKSQDKLKAKYDLYKKTNGFQNINSQLIEKTLKRDMRNFVFKNGSSLDLSSMDASLTNNVKYDARFVFEWNNPEAEFELQFVNPQNRYFTWRYANDEMPQRIKESIENGHMMEEFEFYGKDSKGNWIVNVKYLGNVSTTDTTPFVLKCLIYTNFGKPTEKQEQIIVHLSRKNEKQNVKRMTVR